ncbi:MAG: methionine biosynthesis protein MetW [Pseudomonadales bacterium]|jgi:methionine biosynthesis protein MetW|nr:methionine biosynthesis protein MetW [Pseudomonadales bacterium]
MRADFLLIQDWIAPHSRVLDLGCGNGAFLAYLKQTKHIHDCGLEIDAANIEKCLDAGVNVIEQNMEQGLGNFESQSFDTVVLAQTLQALQRPDMILDEMLRVGKNCILTFPNFAYWRHRVYLARLGRMPKSELLPYEWYDTPNVHLCTIHDFDALCREKRIRVLNRSVVDEQQRSKVLMRALPNLFGINAIYHITR